MAVVVPTASLLVERLVSSSAALTSGQSTWSILRDLNSTFQSSATPDLRQPIRNLMRQMTLGSADSDRGIAPENLARTLIDVVEKLHPLVESHQRDRLLETKESLATFAGLAQATTPASGVFLRRQVVAPQVMDEIVERQLVEAKVIAGGGAIHDAVNTLTFLQGPQILMKRHAQALCALETDFADITPIGSVEGRLDFIQAALEPVLGIGEKIDAILFGIREIREDMRQASGNIDAAGRIVQELVRKGGRVETLRKGLQKLRTDIAQLLLKLRRTELERWVDEKIIDQDTRTRYEFNLRELRAQLEAARNFMELGFKVLRKFSEIGEISRQQSCPFPVDLAEHLNEELLRWVLGSQIELKLNLGGERWFVPGPSESVWQVIVNLVSNAQKAMKDSGKLKISILQVQLTDADAVRKSHHFATGNARAGDYMMLSVRDNGPGIPQDALPRLFDLFYSTNKSGYGLAATRQIVEDMGGFIGVDSATGEPHGTVFTIYLPRAG